MAKLHAKIIGGHRYVPDRIFTSKRDANKHADKIRNMGGFARIVTRKVKHFPTQYIVYYRLAGH